MSFPIVPLESIPTHGLSVDVGAWAHPAVAEALGGPVRSCAGDLELRRTGPHIVVRGHLDASAEIVCDRCSEPLILAIGGEVVCLYSPITALPAVDDDDDRSGPVLPSGLPFPVEDVGEYDGIALDLRFVVGEYFAVERPLRVRCGDLDPAQETACLARSALTPEEDEKPSPFAALKLLKPLPS